MTGYPSRVQARRILSVGPLDTRTQGRLLELDGGTNIFASVKVLAGYTPTAGDYWVIPSEGHQYVATKATFQVTY